jgi:hypothetical protein
MRRGGTSLFVLRGQRADEEHGRIVNQCNTGRAHTKQPTTTHEVSAFTRLAALPSASFRAFNSVNPNLSITGTGTALPIIRNCAGTLPKNRQLTHHSHANRSTTLAGLQPTHQTHVLVRNRLKPGIFANRKQSLKLRVLCADRVLINVLACPQCQRLTAVIQGLSVILLGKKTAIMETERQLRVFHNSNTGTI